MIPAAPELVAGAGVVLSGWPAVVVAAIAALQIVGLAVVALLHERGRRQFRMLSSDALRVLERIEANGHDKP
jgi:hypothetical protein